jgi:hypothetical protein
MMANNYNTNNKNKNSGMVRPNSSSSSAPVYNSGISLPAGSARSKLDMNYYDQIQRDIIAGNRGTSALPFLKGTPKGRRPAFADTIDRYESLAPTAWIQNDLRYREGVDLKAIRPGVPVGYWRGDPAEIARGQGGLKPREDRAKSKLLADYYAAQSVIELLKKRDKRRYQPHILVKDL